MRKIGVLFGLGREVSRRGGGGILAIGRYAFADCLVVSGLKNVTQTGSGEAAGDGYELARDPGVIGSLI